MKKLKILLLSLALLFMITGPAFAQDNTFYDVPSSYWGFSHIESCVHKGLLSGIGDNRFAPEESLTRAQICQILYEAYSPVLPDTLDSSITVDGVQSNAWYQKSMRWALAYDLLDGIYKDAGTFYGAAPDAAADRKCVAMALYCMALKLDAALPCVNSPVDFSDTKDLYWEYQVAITALQQAGVISGMPDGTYGPNHSLTRAQAAVLFDLFTDLPGFTSR